jgi:alpha-beta hydrolase superfamily lysophospholipase
MTTATKENLEDYTTSDGYRCRFRRYPAIGAPRAEIVCLHGIQSHGGWYEYSCRRMAEADFNVSFLDRRGSGLNHEARGDAPSFRRLLDDIADFLHPLRAASHRPIILLAISWGGKLAAALCRRHPGLIDALAMIAPGFCPLVGPSLGQRLAIVAARLVAPRTLFPIPLSDPELFTATSHGQEYIRTDPLSLREATARLLVESARLDAYVRWAAKDVTVPTLILLAERDRIIDNAKTRQFVERFPAPKKLIEYAGAHHTLEFEPHPDRWIGDLLQWLEQRSFIIREPTRSANA